jgi:hypothetical protein
MVHFKRFEANGRFSDKIDTFVDFPMKSLDLTNYMPPPLPPGANRSQLNEGLPMSLEDPRSQLPPYRYDLYGVTNHYGNLSSGHCESWFILIWASCLLLNPSDTAFIASRGGWMYCDDSSVKPVDSKQVIVRNILFFFFDMFFDLTQNYRAKRHMFCSTKESDLRLPISYSIFAAAPIYFCTLLVVAIICILVFALSSFDPLDM